MNKRGSTEELTEEIIFFIIIAVFFAAMFLFVSRAGSQVTINEQIYAKQIALSIDKAKVGTEISLDISKLYEITRKNKFIGEIIKIDNENNNVQVRLVSGKGYEFEFFNNAQVVWELKDELNGGEKLFLKLQNA